MQWVCIRTTGRRLSVSVYICHEYMFAPPIIEFIGFERISSPNFGDFITKFWWFPLILVWNSLDFIRFLWISRISLDFNGFQWFSLNSNGFHKISLDFHHAITIFRWLGTFRHGLHCVFWILQCWSFSIIPKYSVMIFYADGLQPLLIRWNYFHIWFSLCWPFSVTKISLTKTMQF